MSGRGTFAGERALIVGYGKSGRAAAEVLLAEGAHVRASEARTLEELAAEATGDAGLHGRGEEGTDERIEVLAGGHRPEHLDGATLVVVSPGVPAGAPVLSWARDRGLPIWGEVELGARLCRGPYVAVTGTNGKTTTVELIAAMMRAAGLSSMACGNVGFPFSLAAREPLDALAVEVSSFQLAFQQSLHPRVSVLLNLAPDHLDWHGSFPAYAAAKARIYALQGPGDIHVGNRDDALAAAVSREAPCPVRWFGLGAPSEGGVGVLGERLVGRTPAAGEAGSQGGGGALEVDLGAPAGQSRALLVDAAAAAAASLAFGLPAEAIRSAVRSFAPLPHRGTLVAEADSVRFVDDSKATNPHATLAALDGLTRTVLIAGGLAKGVDLAPLAAAAPSLIAVVAIGQAAPEVTAVFDGLVPVRTAPSIEDAVRVAFGLAAPGGTVLLAPACASQDMFRDYGERGDRFSSAARALAASTPVRDGGRARA